MTWWCNGRTLVWRSEGHGFESRGRQNNFFFSFFFQKTSFFALWPIGYIVLFLHYFWLVPHNFSPMCFSHPGPVPVPTQFCPSPDPVPSHTSVPKRTNKSQECKRGRKETIVLYKIHWSNLTWDNSVLCGTDQSHLGQTSLTWDKPFSSETDQSHMGKSSQMWDISISCDTGQYHMGQTSLIWDRPVLAMTDQSHLVQTSLI